MSFLENDKLLGEAALYIDYFIGTTMGRLLQQDLDANDLEGLRFHLKDARKVAHDLEFNPEGA
jgi:hypothetical protein